MAYFKINNNDYSMCVNSLQVNKKHIFNSQTNAAGDTVADYINSKRTIEVGIIPLDNEAMMALQRDVDGFNVLISYRDPKSGLLEENVHCIIPTNGVEYYTIQADKVLYKAFALTIEEL